MRASQLWPERSAPPPGEGGGHLAGPPVCGSFLPPRGHCSPWATQASRRDHPTWTLGFPLSCTGPHPFRAGLDLPGFRAPVTGEQLWPPGLQLGSTLPPLFCLLLFPISRPAWDHQAPGMPHCVPTAQSSAGHSSCGGPPPPGRHPSGAPVSWPPFICNLMGLKQDPLGHARLLTSCLCGLSLEPLEVETLEFLMAEKGSKAGRPGFPLWWYRGGALVLSGQCLLSSMSLLWCTWGQCRK